MLFAWCVRLLHPPPRHRLHRLTTRRRGFSPRQVWIISRHYSNDTRMGSLLERIALELADRVSGQISLRKLFRTPVQQALDLIDKARAVLEQWQEIYMQVREKIEVSGRGARWEFDRKKLFERTNYIAHILGDLRHMVLVVDGFLKFLGPELKAVTGDVHGVNAVVARVDSIVFPIENLRFDVFDKAATADWEAVRTNFLADSHEIEQITKVLIDTSFKKLRSAEAALELLQNFKSIKLEGAIDRQLFDKQNEILNQVRAAPMLLLSSHHV